MDNKRISRKEYKNRFSKSKKRKVNLWGYLVIGIDAISVSLGIGKEGKD